MTGFGAIPAQGFSDPHRTPVNFGDFAYGGCAGNYGHFTGSFVAKITKIMRVLVIFETKLRPAKFSET